MTTRTSCAPPGIPVGRHTHGCQQSFRSLGDFVQSTSCRCRSQSCGGGCAAAKSCGGGCPTGGCPAAKTPGGRCSCGGSIDSQPGQRLKVPIEASDVIHVPGPLCTYPSTTIARYRFQNGTRPTVLQLNVNFAKTVGHPCVCMVPDIDCCTEKTCAVKNVSDCCARDFGGYSYERDMPYNMPYNDEGSPGHYNCVSNNAFEKSQLVATTRCNNDPNGSHSITNHEEDGNFLIGSHVIPQFGVTQTLCRRPASSNSCRCHSDNNSHLRKSLLHEIGPTSTDHRPPIGFTTYKQKSSASNLSLEDDFTGSGRPVPNVTCQNLSHGRNVSVSHMHHIEEEDGVSPKVRLNHTQIEPRHCNPDCSRGSNDASGSVLPDSRPPVFSQLTPPPQHTQHNRSIITLTHQELDY